MENLKKLISELKLISWEVDFSSVYRQFENEQRFDFDARMVTVSKIEFETTKEEFLAKLTATQKFLASVLGKEKMKVVPLAIEQEIQMIPELTLPHPSLHLDPLVTRCGAEVWPDYVHPILKMTLSELANKAPEIHNAEFMLQGKSLVSR
jgi:7,8-dihydro-6-hydroxymethylpterin-pyrophosphokinase